MNRINSSYILFKSASAHCTIARNRKEKNIYKKFNQPDCTVYAEQFLRMILISRRSLHVHLHVNQKLCGVMAWVHERNKIVKISLKCHFNTYNEMY